MASAKIQRMSKSGKGNSASARSSTNSEVPDEIQCKMCKRRYEDPKLLSCLHTFCKDCLEKSLTKHGGILYCPVCPSELGAASDVNKLPSNLLISNLLQAIDLKNGVDAEHCDSCDEKNAVSSRCFECGDLLCNSCVDAHRRVRFTRQHRVVSLQNLGAEGLMRAPACPSHAQETLKMYCKQCREPVCRSCILDRHKEHALISLKEALETAKPKLRGLLVATRAKIPMLQRKLKEAHVASEKLESKVDAVIKEIQGTSARVLMAVKRREKELYRALRRIHDKRSDELEGRRVALQNELAQVLDCCEFAERLANEENEAMVLHVSEVTYARLRTLGEQELGSVPEIHDDEIEYTADEKPLLDELRIYGKITSREEKVKKQEKANEAAKQRQGKIDGAEEDGKDRATPKTQRDSTKSHDEDKAASVQRRGSWLETLTNPRALLRRLSFSGGDDGDGKRPEPKSDSKEQESVEDAENRDANSETRSKQSQGGEAAVKSEKQERQEKESTEKIQDGKEPEKAAPKRRDSLSQARDPKEKSKVTDDGHSSSTSPRPPPSPPDASTAPRTTDVPQGPAAREHDHAPRPSETQDSDYETPTSQSILKNPAPQPGADDWPADSSQAWSLPTDQRSPATSSLPYLPTLKILTKNRRGRPREVEIQLESPDHSIVSAQILNHKNGIFTIFYCPRTPGEHNLYVNVGGKHIRHGQKALNFYGKFAGMGAEELFLARRALSCIRWQVTPGFIEMKNRKIVANPDM